MHREPELPAKARYDVRLQSQYVPTSIVLGPPVHSRFVTSYSCKDVCHDAARPNPIDPDIVGC